MKTHNDGLGPEQILEQNAVYTRWRQLVEYERLPEADAELRTSEDLGLPAEAVEDGIFAGRLTESEILYRVAASNHERARADRNAMVRRALEHGWSHADIALATALTRSRVGQIALAVAQETERDQRSTRRQRRRMGKV